MMAGLIEYSCIVFASANRLVFQGSKTKSRFQHHLRAATRRSTVVPEHLFSISVYCMSVFFSPSTSSSFSATSAPVLFGCFSSVLDGLRGAPCGAGGPVCSRSRRAVVCSACKPWEVPSLDKTTCQRLGRKSGGHGWASFCSQAY